MASVLTWGPSPPPEFPGCSGTTTLSAPRARRACPSRASGWSSLRPRLGASRVAYAFLVYMLPPLPRRSVWASYFAHSPSRISLPRKGHRVGLRIVLFEACSAFTHVAACTLALSPIRDTLSEGFSQFVTSMAAPVASGWSVCRVGLAPTGKRRLVTAHTQTEHSLTYSITSSASDIRLSEICTPKALAVL